MSLEQLCRFLVRLIEAIQRWVWRHGTYQRMIVYLMVLYVLQDVLTLPRAYLECIALRISVATSFSILLPGSTYVIKLLS